MLNILKIICLNITLIFSFLGVMFIMPGATFLVYNLVINKSMDIPDSRALLPNYDNVNWALKHFSEFHKLKAPYKDFLVWQFDDFEGETINIKNGIRFTNIPPQIKSQHKKFLFFGGSTTFGSGVNDENTYPSIFSNKVKLKAVNHGVSGYSSRQSLIALNNQYITNERINLSKNFVVFYDGVNDVVHRCRNDTIGMSTQRENQIKNLFWNKKYHFERTFSQLIDFTNAFVKRITKLMCKKKINVDKLYICDNNEFRAKEIASSLVKTWKVAFNIALANDDNFVAILQPVAFTGTSKVNHLNLNSDINKEIGKQYKILYPLIKEYAKISKLPFIDLTNALNVNDYVYIDFSHLSPLGNELVANSIIENIQKLSKFIN